MLLRDTEVVLQYTWGYLEEYRGYYHADLHRYDGEVDLWRKALDARGRPLPPFVELHDIGVGERYREVPEEEYYRLSCVINLRQLTWPGRERFYPPPVQYRGIHLEGMRDPDAF